MLARENVDFCTECRKETEYDLRTEIIRKRIKDRDYSFHITTAVCRECGEEMSLPGLIDRNIREIDEQYRQYEQLISVKDMENLMKIYQIGKGPLALALGFGEVTIARYIAGQIPSKEYSDIMKNALSSPSYMKQMLRKNREKLAPAAYHKAMRAAETMEQMFAVSEPMRGAISYLFDQLEEVTPLMLQKLLYFIQGVYSALYQEPMFPEQCEAWVHGPVYPVVYELFRDFKYNPIEDARFAVLHQDPVRLSDSERQVVDLVASTFGLYGGKVLERITHKEEPWKEARRGYSDGIPSYAAMDLRRLQSYYEAVNQKYAIGSEEGLRRYVQDMIGTA